MSEKLQQIQDVPGIDADKPMFPISVLADILQVHQRTLRIYDEAKILVPSRSPKNRRLYSLNDIERSKFVQYLTRDLGINLAGIKIVFHLLEELKVKPEHYTNYISKVAENINISVEEQEQNKIRLSRRGRKSNKEKEAAGANNMATNPII